MRQASAQYLLEESRLRGAQPRVRAVLYPFDLECGLAPGSGTFLNTAYGGEAGRLDMAAGYFTSGSWLSPVLQGFSPHLDEIVPSWEDAGGHMDLAVSLRSGATPAAVAAADWVRLAAGVQVSVGPCFQIQVQLQESGRAWAVDSAGQADGFTAYAAAQLPDAGYESYAVAAGGLEKFQLAGYLTLPESEIIQTGAVRVELARDFAALRGADLALELDHRLGQWLNRPENAYLFDGDWTGKLLDLYHGWDAGNAIEWQLVYRGTLQRLTDMAHSWQQPHRVRLETQDYIVARLQQAIGAPTASGERRPFMRGAYRAPAELVQATPAAVSAPVKSGAGSASLQVLGEYRGDLVKEYLIEVLAGGEVGAATCRWSDNLGQSWQDAGLKTAGADTPLSLEDGLVFYWEAGSGSDLMAGDRWSFTATPPVYDYQVAGGPFEAITDVYLNGAATGDRVSADAMSGRIQVTGRSAQVEARVIKDGTSHPVDILVDLLGEAGLGDYLDQDAFALAKSLTAEYALGVRFENLSAAQAVREIVKRCLYDFWIDFGEIKISAYLGED